MLFLQFMMTKLGLWGHKIICSCRLKCINSLSTFYSWIHYSLDAFLFESYTWCFRMSWKVRHCPCLKGASLVGEKIHVSQLYEPKYERHHRHAFDSVPFAWKRADTQNSEGRELMEDKFNNNFLFRSSRAPKKGSIDEIGRIGNNKDQWRKWWV